MYSDVAHFLHHSTLISLKPSTYTYEVYVRMLFSPTCFTLHVCSHPQGGTPKTDVVQTTLNMQGNNTLRVET